MSTSSQRVKARLRRLFGDAEPALPTPHEEPETSGIPTRTVGDAAARARRWRQLAAPDTTRAILEPTEWSGIGAIENLIGRVEIPLGVAGPLPVDGLSAHGDYWLPLATSEAALVASINRGCVALRKAGGARSLCLSEGITRAPCFCFTTLAQAATFCAWLTEQEAALKAIPPQLSRFTRLEEIRFSIEGSHAYVILEFTTGDAAGQNMSTLAAEAICEWIHAHCPEQARRWYVEANMSGDKKPSLQSFVTVRGRKVAAEAVIPVDVVHRVLRTTPAEMEAYWRVSALGGVLSGTIGVQGHYANPLAALFLATGQDIACVAEAAVGVTRMQVNDAGALYASVTLPNLVVGTVGGGTSLPTAAACLDLMGLKGTTHGTAFAEVTGALCLAGELSIIAALSAGHFASAHRKLARRPPPTESP